MTEMFRTGATELVKAEGKELELLDKYSIEINSIVIEQV